MQKAITINAILPSNHLNSKKSKYQIQFSVNPNTGLCKLINETPTKVSLRSHQFLQLISDVYQLIGFEPERKFVTFKTYYALNKTTHPSLLANDGIYYQLDKRVDGSWIENVTLPQLVRYLWDVSTGIDETFHTLAYVYGDFPYTLLRLCKPSEWEISIQKE